MKFAKLVLPALLLILVISFATFTDVRASKPYCNVVEHSLTMFEGNVFKASWIGSRNLYRAFVAWPLDGRNHWAAYELFPTEESFGAVTEHTAYGLIDLPEGTWKRGELIIMLTPTSPQEGHKPPYTTTWTHGQLLVVLGLNPPEEGQEELEAPPLCKADLAPLLIQPRP
jgi:hypothetical protein